MIDADYTTALSLLLHYSLPTSLGGPAGLVRDALYLDRNRSSSAGADLIRRYSGRYPALNIEQRSSSPFKTIPTSARSIRHQVHSEPILVGMSSPSRLSARFSNQQKGLEALFQDVSGEVSRRTEGWTLAKAVKGAVGEVRRNVNYLQGEATSSRTSGETPKPIGRTQRLESETVRVLTQRIQELEDRNKVLAKMLGSALESLRKQKESTIESKQNAENEDFNMSLAKIQFVQVYLADPEIPIPVDEIRSQATGPKAATQAITESAMSEKKTTTDSENRSVSPKSDEKATFEVSPQTSKVTSKASTNHRTEPLRRPQHRPPLAESSFSFMLGEDRRRSSFVSSATVPPEQRRDSDTKSRQKQLIADGKEAAVKKGSDSEDDGFTMSSLRGPNKI